MRVFLNPPVFVFDSLFSLYMCHHIRVKSFSAPAKVWGFVPTCLRLYSFVVVLVLIGGLLLDVLFFSYFSLAVVLVFACRRSPWCTLSDG